MRWSLFVQLLLLALWFGSGFTIMLIGAPSAFAAAPDRTTAANIVGLMLGRWHLIALLLPAALLAIDWKNGLQHNARVLLLVAAIGMALIQVGADAKVRRMRAASLTPISELAPTDPYRRRFGLLHGVSSIVMLVNVLLAAAVLYTVARDQAPTISNEGPRTLEL